MTKQGFIEFSLEHETTIDAMLDLFDDHKWIFHWDYLKDIIVKNNMSVVRIIRPLRILRDLKIQIKENKFEFLKFVCKMYNKGFNEQHIISKYLDLIEKQN